MRNKHLTQRRPNRTIVPYASLKVRIPSSLKSQVDQLKDEFYRHINQGGDPLNPPDLIGIYLSSSSNLLDQHKERLKQILIAYADFNEKYNKYLRKRNDETNLSPELTPYLNQFSRLIEQVHHLLRDMGQYSEGGESDPVSSDPLTPSSDHD